MGSRATFGEALTRANRGLRPAFLVVGHFAGQHVGDSRPIDMVVESESAAWLNRDAAHPERAAFAGLDLGGQIKGPECLFALTNILRGRLPLAGRRDRATSLRHQRQAEL